MRLTVAAAVIALAVPAHAGPTHADPHRTRPPKPPRNGVLFRTEILAGNGQTARAYAEPGKKKYVTEFPDVLVVRIVGWPREGGNRRVHFHLATKGCTLTAVDQPNAGHDVDDRYDSHPNTYKAKIVKGVAHLRIAVESDSPDGTYTVVAKPGVPNSVPATFTLTSR